MINENDDPIGGEGQVVEIDETYFRKRKYHRGPLLDGFWVFVGEYYNIGP
jgi:hypothetical protein